MDARLQFEWDPAKADANLSKHGVSFAFGARLFLDEWRVDLDVTRTADGEQRHKTLGVIEGRLFSAVYTLRDDRIRLISVRRCNSQEERTYGAIHP